MPLYLVHAAPAVGGGTTEAFGDPMCVVARPNETLGHIQKRYASVRKQP